MGNDVTAAPDSAIRPAALEVQARSKPARSRFKFSGCKRTKPRRSVKPASKNVLGDIEGDCFQAVPDASVDADVFYSEAGMPEDRREVTRRIVPMSEWPSRIQRVEKAVKFRRHKQPAAGLQEFGYRTDHRRLGPAREMLIGQNQYHAVKGP